MSKLDIKSLFQVLPSFLLTGLPKNEEREEI